MPSLADQLRAIADQIEAAGLAGDLQQSAPPPAFRPGYVAVAPRGSMAHGVVRYYPEAEQGESLFTYASRVGPMRNPDAAGQPYIPEWLQGSAMFSPTMGPPLPYPGATVPERFDAVLHPSDWSTSAPPDTTPSPTEYYNGPIAVADLTQEDRDFLKYVTANFQFNPAIVHNQSDVWFAICKGTLAQINDAISTGGPLRAGYDANAYHGAMRGYVDQVANGLLKPNVTRG